MGKEHPLWVARELLLEVEVEVEVGVHSDQLIVMGNYIECIHYMNTKKLVEQV